MKIATANRDLHKQVCVSLNMQYIKVNITKQPAVNNPNNNLAKNSFRFTKESSSMFKGLQKKVHKPQTKEFSHNYSNRANSG